MMFCVFVSLFPRGYFLYPFPPPRFVCNGDSKVSLKSECGESYGLQSLLR